MAPVNSRYRFLAEVVSAQGGQVGALQLQPDWSPALEWCRFQGLREGRQVPVVNAGPADVEPVWDALSGPPYVEKVRIGMTDRTGETFCCDLPAAFFNDAIERESAAMVANGTLTAGADVTVKVCAYAHGANAAPDSSANAAAASVPPDNDDLEGEFVEVGIETLSKPLPAMIEGSRREGGEHWVNGDLPVFVPAGVMHELQSMASADDRIECGAILIGNLCTDSTGSAGCPEMFLEVSAQIPARHTIAEYSSLTFTGETWASVNAAIRLRARHEMILGWCHSHPHFCRDCTDISRLYCVLSKPHFSESDMNVHRTVFSHGYQVALLLSFLGEELPRTDMFAWREGRIAPRGFYVV